MPRRSRWDLFRARSLPFMARSNYLIEVQHLLLWGIFAGMFEGTVSSIVVAKTFDAEPWLITIVMATPMAANLMGIAWGALASGRRKLPLFLFLGVIAALLIGSVALTPPTVFGGWIFAGQILLARIALSGCMTVRSGLWKHNYPTAQRGRIAARLQFVRISLAITTVTSASLLFDVNPEIYVYLYPAAALIGIVALVRLRGLRVRGERAAMGHRARQSRRRAHVLAHLWSPVRRSVDVLARDAGFRRYCAGMMLLGFANVMIMPIMTIIVTRQLVLSYYHSCNLLEVLPRLLMMASLLPWAGLFDRLGVVRFRVFNALTWCGAVLFGGLGAAVIFFGDLDSLASFTCAVTLLALSRCCEGLGRGGGAIAWNIGHLHFAESDQAEVYMGIHVFLTGLRGLTAPFVGTWLYLLGGPVAFLVALGLGTASVFTFASLARREDRAQKKAAENIAAIDRYELPAHCSPASANGALSPFGERVG